MPVLMVFCSEILLMCKWIQGYSLPSLLSGSVYLVLCWVLLDLTSLQKDKHMFTYILLQADIQFNQHHLLKMLSFFHCVFPATLSKVRRPTFLALCLGIQFDSIVKHVCFSTNPIVVLLLYLFNYYGYCTKICWLV